MRSILEEKETFFCIFCKPESRAEEQKWNCLPDPEPKLRIAAPTSASFYLPQTWRNLIEKYHGSWKSFCNITNLILLLLSKKVIFKVSYITRSGAGAEIRICGSVEPEPKEIFSAPQHWFITWVVGMACVRLGGILLCWASCCCITCTTN